MHNKKGFIFLETIVVLIIVTLSLALLLASYTLISTKTREKEFYDKASDKYLLYAISNLGTTTTINYSTIAESNSVTAMTSYTCNDTLSTHNHMYPDGKCTEVFNEMNIKYLYIVQNVDSALKSGSATSVFDNGTIAYMKTLQKCYDAGYASDYVSGEDEEGSSVQEGTLVKNKTCDNPIHYMIGVFYRNQNYYFASIEL